MLKCSIAEGKLWSPVIILCRFVITGVAAADSRLNTIAFLLYLWLSKSESEFLKVAIQTELQSVTEQMIIRLKSDLV